MSRKRVNLVNDFKNQIYLICAIFIWLIRNIFVVVGTIIVGVIVVAVVTSYYSKN